MASLPLPLLVLVKTCAQVLELYISPHHNISDSDVLVLERLYILDT